VCVFGGGGADVAAQEMQYAREHEREWRERLDAFGAAMEQQRANTLDIMYAPAPAPCGPWGAAHTGDDGSSSVLVLLSARLTGSAGVPTCPG
jgi:hypothetical protein